MTADKFTFQWKLQVKVALHKLADNLRKQQESVLPVSNDSLHYKLCSQFITAVQTLKNTKLLRGLKHQQDYWITMITNWSFSWFLWYCWQYPLHAVNLPVLGTYLIWIFTINIRHNICLSVTHHINLKMLNERLRDTVWCTNHNLAYILKYIQTESPQIYM